MGLYNRNYFLLFQNNEVANKFLEESFPEAHELHLKSSPLTFNIVMQLNATSKYS